MMLINKIKGYLSFDFKFRLLIRSTDETLMFGTGKCFMLQRKFQRTLVNEKSPHLTREK